jgi:hypothetical protein
LLFRGNKPPFGAFHDHRRFPFLALRRPCPALGHHRYPIRRVERIGGGYAFPKIDADEGTAITRDPIILADQTGDSFIGVGRPVDGLDQLRFGCSRRSNLKTIAGSVSRWSLTR